MSGEKSKGIDNDATKRRYNRILTRYDEGLRACERGVTSFEFEELVPPPGYPPLTDRSKMGRSIKLANNDQKSLPAKPETSDHCLTKNKTEAIVGLLIKRQDELKQAAKVAKQAGNIELAKTYIRSCLGMNQMIQAAEAGFPIDLTQLPRPPTFTDSATSKPILSGLKCDPPVKYAIAFNSLSEDDNPYKDSFTELEYTDDRIQVYVHPFMDNPPNVLLPFPWKCTLRNFLVLLRRWIDEKNVDFP
ncbi:hypothetical protein MN116_008901 [Schistosoma mekongi]|uniref:DM14 domain-containing protein n=1 Tax=Schistosoma mekongi TaxID=38744 RepID=A0AAE1Z571_SCHME|nr:hypothetical protein MN116_008901 [Schistosoma mekongi]